MRPFILAVSSLCLLFTAPVHAQQVKAPTGLWLTENGRSVIELYQCRAGEALMCGKIAWIIEGGMQYDTKNPDASKHDTPLCGMNLLSDLRMETPAKWTGGKVYKADEGKYYDANLTILGDNKLEVRGYVGMSMFGKSQTWTRVSAKDYPPCKAPSR
ncbi:MAG: DUF2147 domain-containing protein [Micavibrio sp.]